MTADLRRSFGSLSGTGFLGFWRLGSRSLGAPPGTRSILGYLMIDLLNSIGTLPANPTIPLSRPDQRPGEVLASRVGTAR